MLDQAEMAAAGSGTDMIPRYQLEQARRASAVEIKAAKARRGRRRDDDDEDGGALVPARPQGPRPDPLVGAALSPAAQ